jgi:esterase/lipase
MVSKEINTTYIHANLEDIGRPRERPPKTNWKIELLKKGVSMIQHVSPRTASNIIWSQFTKPGRSRFTPAQQELVDQAEIGRISYFGHELTTYRWGDHGPKVLLSHGWNSKIADFRKMIDALVNSGYVVEGIDMKAHGNSGGSRTALPEIRDVLKQYYVKNGPYRAVIGYSIGGIAAGIMVSELSESIQPEQLFLIAAPSHTRYFFYDVVKGLGYKDKVYHEMCSLVNENYFESIDYFDLRNKVDQLCKPNIHLVYCENDQTVPFDKGIELKNTFKDAQFVHAKGLGHYKIIAYNEVIDYIGTALSNNRESVRV